MAYKLTLSVEKIVYIIMWRKRYENWWLGISKYAGLIPKAKKKKTFSKNISKKNNWDHDSKWTGDKIQHDLTNIKQQGKTKLL